MTYPSDHFKEQEPPEEPADVIDEEPFTIKKGVNDVVKAGERLKSSGWKPWRDMVGNYAGRFVDAINELADGLEGKKKKKDD